MIGCARVFYGSAHAGSATLHRSLQMICDFPLGNKRGGIGRRVTDDLPEAETARSTPTATTTTRRTFAVVHISETNTALLITMISL